MNLTALHGNLLHSLFSGRIISLDILLVGLHVGARRIPTASNKFLQSPGYIIYTSTSRSTKQDEI